MFASNFLLPVNIAYFPNVPSFHLGPPRELIPPRSSPRKKANSLQVSLWWGSLSTEVKMNEDKITHASFLLQSPGSMKNLTSFEFRHFLFLTFLNNCRPPRSLPVCFCMFPTKWALGFVSLKYGKESSVFKNPCYYVRYFYAINQLEAQESGHHSLIMSSFSK